MKTTKLHYGVEIPIGSTSEFAHRVETSHFADKRNNATWARKTKAEKQEVKTRMYKHPAKHGSPVGKNV